MDQPSVVFNWFRTGSPTFLNYELQCKQKLLTKLNPLTHAWDFYFYKIE